MQNEYMRWDAKLTGRNHQSRKVGNNTYAERRGENAIAIRLHATDVVTFNKDGSVVVNSGGWKTVTTKDRINRFLPNGLIRQDKGQWYWMNIGEEVPTGRAAIVFNDGDMIRHDGTLAATAPPQADRANKQLRKQVSDFAQKIADSLPLEQPGNGDCLYCNSHLKSQNGKTLGDEIGDKEHLLSHMKEGYMVPSLVHNALVAGGAGSAYFGMAFNGGGFPLTDWGRKAIKKMVSKFMLRRLGGVA